MNRISFTEKTFPKKLLHIRNCPKELYLKGDASILESKLTLGVVGSRRISDYGRLAIKKIIRGLLGTNFVIVSGFMYGADSEAHKAALENKLKTIAVLPYGIDYSPPEYQKQLYKDVLSEGCLVSEYEGSLKPQKWTFVNRNRIIAGLVDALLVIEAAEKSGSLITAKFAKRFNKQVFALPGNIFNQNSYGTNKLIQEGAHLLTSSKEILNFYGIKGSVAIKRPIFSNSDDQRIYNVLLEGPQPLSSLADKLDIAVSKVNYTLTQFQLSGYVTEEKGVFSVS